MNLTIQGPNSTLFNFTLSGVQYSQYPERIEYKAIFTPTQFDVGTYNITINITDLSNASSLLRFNLSVFGISDAPIITEISAANLSINESISFDLNANDDEY